MVLFYLQKRVGMFEKLKEILNAEQLYPCKTKFHLGSGTLLKTTAKYSNINLTALSGLPFLFRKTNY